MTTNRGPFVRLHLYARRMTMPTILRDPLSGVRFYSK
jgi:hypothetical protein